MRNKKIIALAAAAVMLAGCSEAPAKEESSQETTTTTTAATEPEPVESKPEEKPEEDDALYDSTPISQAYLTGDTSKLDSFQKEIYDRAVKVLDEVVTDGMDDYAKELAVHDFIVKNVTYDLENMSIFETHGEHATDPYGALVDGKCICSGYTTTFKMFMDMLEIPCISIKAGDADGEDHAWNMVKINGHWYYMDVTWDDPVPDKPGRPEQHRYFNTSKELMSERHVWDSSSDPVCDSVEDSFIAHNIVTASTVDDVKDRIMEAYNNKVMNVYLDLEDKEAWGVTEADDWEDYLNAVSISKNAEDVTKAIIKETDAKYNVYWQRIEFEGKLLLVAYII